MSSWKVAAAQDGRPYYYNGEGQTTWDKPSDFDATEPATPAPPQNDPEIDAAWQETTAQNGRKYYWNTKTKVTTWDVPEGFLRQQQNARPAPSFVAGGSQNQGGNDYGPPERRMDRRDRDHGLPQKPSFDGGRGGGMPRDQRQESSGFRGPMPVKTDEPEYATQEQAEEAFFKLLRKYNISPDTDWEDAIRVVIREREYRALKDPKERKVAFEKYCLEVRAQEKGKERERREKVREDFRKMLTTHDDIKHYTRWKTARPIIEREAVFRSAGGEDERRRMFDEYILELKRKNADKEIQTLGSAREDLDGMLQALIVDPDTKWADAKSRILENERFLSDNKFTALSRIDVLTAFDSHIKTLDRVANDEKQKEKRSHTRRQRQARDNFRQLLVQMQREGRIKAGARWKDFYPYVAQDDRYLKLIGMPGSSPLDLFWDVAEEEERILRGLRTKALDVLEDRQYEMTTTTTLADFSGVMRTDPRTGDFDKDQMSIVYERLMIKIRKRAEDARAIIERDQRKAVDVLRSIIKHLDPPVRIGDDWEAVVPRLQKYDEYKALDDAGRKNAFDKYIRRLKEKEDDVDRDRPRNERDRDHRNGSRRDHERDRDRRHRTRTPPEADAYEADRKRAQADRERQYRKASFGLTPPPRDRRDEREDRYRRPERNESMSIYDRERREREMERERSYISRADPRDKGRTLDYGDEEAVGSRPGSIRKRRDSEGSAGGKRDVKRPRRGPTRTPEAETALKEDSPALQSGSEEGEIEEI